MPTLTLAFKGKILQVFPLQDGVFSIGREPSCDIHIDSLAIEPQHARIVIRDNRCTITPSNTDNPTFVNHKLINEHVLEHNDMIRIGKHTLKYRDDTLQIPLENQQAQFTVQAVNATEQSTATAAEITPANPVTAMNGWLQIMNGKNLGKTFKLQSSLTDLGKLGMSPALIALRSSGYFISNLTDDNQLIVADKNIGEQSYPLQDGDLIKLGKVTLQFHLHA